MTMTTHKGGEKSFVYISFPSKSHAPSFHNNKLIMEVIRIGYQNNFDFACGYAQINIAEIF